MQCKQRRGISKQAAAIVAVLSLCFSTTPFIQPAFAASAKTPETAQQDASRQYVRTIAFQGNLTLSNDQLAAVVRPFYYKAVQPDEIEKAVFEAYKKAGYPLILVQADQKADANWTLNVRIKEMTVRNVSVQGNKRFPEKAIRGLVPALQEGKAPNVNEIARQVVFSNDNPARKIHVDFRVNGDDTVNAYVLVAEQKSLYSGISVDNSGTEKSGKIRINGYYYDTNASTDNSGHTLGLSFSISDNPDKLNQVGLYYGIPLPRTGSDSIYITASQFNSDVGQVAGANLPNGNPLFSLSSSGKGNSVGLHYVHDIARTAKSRQTIDFGIDLRNYDNINTLKILDDPGEDIGVDISTMPFSLTYQSIQREKDYDFGLSVGLVSNIPNGGRNSTERYEQYRPGTSANYSLWRLNAGYRHRLGNGWLANFVGEGQYSNKSLIYPEQFGVGGQNSVRGLSERDISGDKGYRVSAELYTPEISAGQRFLIFTDLGRCLNKNAGFGELASDTAVSYGIGWRYTAGGLSLRADWATVTNGTVYTAKNTHKFHFSAAKNF